MPRSKIPFEDKFFESVKELKRMNETYLWNNTINTPEFDGLIKILDSNKDLQNFVPEATLEHLKHAKNNPPKSRKQELNLIAHVKVAQNGTEVILPLEYQEDQNYTGLLRILFEHCTNILKSLGEIKTYSHKDILCMHVEDGKSDNIAKNIYRLSENPQKLAEFGIHFGLDVEYLPIETNEMTNDVEEQHENGKISARNTMKDSLWNYVSEHGSITLDQAESMGYNRNSAYQQLHALEKQGKIQRNGKVYKFVDGEQEIAPEHLDLKIETNIAKKRKGRAFSPMRQTLVDYVTKNKEITVKLATEIGHTTDGNAYYHLNRLENDGVFEKKDGKYVMRTNGSYHDQQPPEKKTQPQETQSQNGEFEEKLIRYVMGSGGKTTLMKAWQSLKSDYNTIKIGLDTLVKKGKMSLESGTYKLVK